MEAAKKHLQLTFKMMTDSNARLIEIIHNHTDHSHLRACQRSLSQEKITAVLQYGELVYKQGLLFYILGEKNIPPSLIKKRDLLKNTVIIVSGDSNQLITCYRSRNPFKHIKIKSKRFLKNYKKAA